MKCNLLSIVFVLSAAALAIGQNLVPNPSFEEFTDCPYGPGWTDGLLIDWNSWRYTPDYFNVCSNDMQSYAGVPANLLGIQTPITGDGYSGLYTFGHVTALDREYLAAELLEPLIPGEDYYVLIHASQVEGEAGDFSQEYRCASNHIGIRFFKDPEYHYETNPFVPDNIVHIDHEEILANSDDWTLIEGWFTADTDYNWVAIGNFFDGENTQILIENPFGNCFAIYYIENVCVALNPSDCDYLLAANTLKKSTNPVEIYPNPTSDVLNIRFNQNENGYLKIYNIVGTTILDRSLQTGLTTLLTDRFSRGLYFLEVRTNKNESITFKIILQ